MGNWCCGICGEEFDTEPEIDEHMERHVTTSGRILWNAKKKAAFPGKDMDKKPCGGGE